MNKKFFGYPKFINNEMILTTYENEYRDMLMDIRLYQIEKGEIITFYSDDEEIAVLLLSGNIDFICEERNQNVQRRNVFVDGPYAMHVSCTREIQVKAYVNSEILVQKTKNSNKFEDKLYEPKDAPWKYSSQRCFGNVANRRVNTIFDYDIQPKSNMVLGEVLNDPGNWSGYLPHRHPQPECYFFLFDYKEGFGASFIGDQVYKSVDHSFSAIPGGELHPQVSAPGFQMYTCWMIRHLEGKPWLQSDRCEDDTFKWLHKAPFDPSVNQFVKGKEGV